VSTELTCKRENYSCNPEEQSMLVVRSETIVARREVISLPRIQPLLQPIQQSSN
jgi:hypothetical protein